MVRCCRLSVNALQPEPVPVLMKHVLYAYRLGLYMCEKFIKRTSSVSLSGVSE